MAKSRLALLLLLPAATMSESPAAAKRAPTVEELIDKQRLELRQGVGLAPCPVAEVDGGEIVVCGRRGPDPYRVSVEIPPERGGRFGSAIPAMTAGTGSCSTVGPNQRCSGGLDVIHAGRTLYKMGGRLFGKGD